MLFGYLNTVLYIPNISYTSTELEAIIRHELMHYRAKDLWYKLLLVIVCDVYWFNPLFRLMKNMAFYDVECVCDENATKNMNLDAKKDYGSIILKTMTGVKVQSFTFTTQFAGTKKNAKKRIDNIFSAHNRKVGITVFCMFILVLALGTGCVSVAVSKKDNNETEKTKTNNVITIDSTILAEQGDTLLSELKGKYPNYDITTTDLVYDGTDEFFNQTPTVFSIANTDTIALAEKGKVADITEILSEKGWLNQMDEALKATVSDKDGRVYGIPFSPYAYGILVNTKMFKEAGLTNDEGVPVFPTTWEELADTAVKIKEATGKAGISLIAGDYAGSIQFCNMAWNFGATQLGSYDADEKYKAQLDSDAAIEAMKFVKDLKWKYDVLTDDPTQENYMTVFEEIANGTAAMCIGANDIVSMPASFGMKSTDLAMGAMPAGPGGDQYSLYGSTVFVFSADASPEEIEVILSLFEMMGYGPVANDANKNRVQSKIQSSVEQGGPAISEIPVWKNAEILDYEQSVLDEIGNTNQEFYKSYFDKIITPGNMKGLEVAEPGTLCDELAIVLKKVVTDKDADVTQLMKTANDNWQKAIDTNY